VSAVGVDTCLEGNKDNPMEQQSDGYGRQRTANTVNLHAK